MKTFIKVIIGLIIVAVFTVGGLCLGIYIRTKENPVNYISNHINEESETKNLSQDLSIEDFKSALLKNNFEITDEITKMGTLIGANELGYGYEINGAYIEIYEYDEKSSEELTKQNIESAKEKNVIIMPAFNNVELPAIYNKGLMLVSYEEHPNKEKILEIFNNL
ncbi:MAG: hypothetical protein J6K45_04740 [Clostridia bacterium]|nr:hypothetical protein [Clostridia bacterium]